MGIEKWTSPNTAELSAERLDLLQLGELATKYGIEPLDLTAGPRLPGYHAIDRPEENSQVASVYVLRPPLTESARAGVQPGIAFDKAGQLYAFEPEKAGNGIVLRHNCSHVGMAPEGFDPMWLAMIVQSAHDNIERRADAYADWGRHRQTSGLIP
jgi:hypothetical protein